MWFLFGFITLISFTIYSAYKRINAPAKGEKEKFDGIQYWYHTDRNKHGITGFRLSVTAPAGYDFSFKKETWSDHFFKKIGVCSEHQVWHDAFDNTVYIVSDDSYLCAQLSRNVKLIDQTLKLFMAGEIPGREVKEIRCKSGFLSIYYKTRSNYTKSIHAVGREAAPVLAAIAKEIQQIPASVKSKWRDPFVIKASLILAISSGLAINGLIHLVRLLWTNIPFTVDGGLLWKDSVLLGFAGVVMLMIAALIFLKRSARTHLVLIELFFFGTFGAVATSFTELRDNNMEFDTGIASEYVVTLSEKYIVRGRRSTSYYLIVRDWNKAGGTLKKVKVSPAFYSKVANRDKIIVRQKPGYLGYRWVETMAKQ